MTLILLSSSITIIPLMDVAITQSLMIRIEMYKIVEFSSENNASVQFKR